MIRLESVHVVFAEGTVLEKTALRGIDLEIHEGDFVTVIGSNGAGKSTLLNTIAGEIIPSRGHVFIDLEDVTFRPAYKRASFVSRVFQDPLAGTCGELTIAENLALAYRRGQKKRCVRALPLSTRTRFQDDLVMLGLGLEDRLDTPMSLLSGGQRQAISLLMASLSRSKILLLDEHTSALDPKTAAFVMELTQKIILEKGLTALMVTHSLQTALHVGTRTLMLKDCQIVDDISGEERDQLTVPDILAKFGSGADDDRLLLS